MAVGTRITPYYRLEAWAFDLYLRHFQNKPVEKASREGADWLAAIGPLSSPHQTAMKNLALAFPERSTDERRAIALDAWRELGRTVAELPHTRAFTSLGPNANVELAGREHLDALKSTGGVIIAGHFSNWEAMAVALIESGLTCHITYRPANNPIIDQRIIAIRERYGSTLQAAKGVEGGKGLMRALAQKHVIVLMNDQKYNEGVAAPLFGHNAMTADGPTRLALRYRVPLAPISLQRTDGVRFRMTAHPHLPLDYAADPETEIPRSVARVNAFMEARIREAPAQWFWVHRRWPKEAWAKAGLD